MHKVSLHMQSTNNSTASSKKRRNHLEPSVPLRAQSELDSTKAITPENVAHSSQLFSAVEAPFTRKNTMFRANPIAVTPYPWFVKMKIWCKASFKFQVLKMWKRSFGAMFPSNSNSWRCENEALVRCFLLSSRVHDVNSLVYSLQLYSTLFSSTLLSSNLLCSTLLSSPLLHSTLLCSRILY